MSSKVGGGKGGKSKTSSEAKVLTTRSSKAGLQVSYFIGLVTIYTHMLISYLSE